MDSGFVTVRFWAGARAAAGLGSVAVPVQGPTTVAEVTRAAVAAVPASRHTQLSRVVAACSVLVDDQPLGGADPSEVPVAAGQTVEMLPPFAGG